MNLKFKNNHLNQWYSGMMMVKNKTTTTIYCQIVQIIFPVNFKTGTYFLCKLNNWVMLYLFIETIYSSLDM